MPDIQNIATGIIYTVTSDELATIQASVLAPLFSYSGPFSSVTPSPMNFPLQKTDVTPVGTDATTTARLAYGINVIATASYTANAVRLPETPIEGNLVVVVNHSSVPIRVYPSVSGGSMNGTVDGFFVVAPNSKAVEFWCWENPNPGDWSVPMRVENNVVQIPDFSIAHTNGGSATVRVGTVSPQSSSIGGGIDGSNNLVLTPAAAHWRSENGAATAVKMKVLTNIVAADLTDDVVNNMIQVWRSTAYKTAANAGTAGQRETLFIGHSGVGTGNFYPDTIGGIVGGGQLSSPPEIGDKGTFYGEVLAPTNLGSQVGAGGAYSAYYYIFGFQIPGSAATKTYKFRVLFEWI